MTLNNFGCRLEKTIETDCSEKNYFHNYRNVTKFRIKAWFQNCLFHIALSYYLNLIKPSKTERFASNHALGKTILQNV